MAQVAVVLVEDRVLVCRICKHALFLSVATLRFITTLFHVCWGTLMAIIDRHSQIRASGVSNPLH